LCLVLSNALDQGCATIQPCRVKCT